jgi:hypothetical protein
MFLTCCSPMSSNAKASLSRTCSRTTRLTQISAGLGEGFEASGYVDAVAENIIRFDDHVAQVDPNPEADALVFGCVGIAVDHCALDLYGTANRIHHARKFRQHPVADVLYDAPTVLIDLLARGHREGAMMDRAETTRMAIDL